MSKRLTSRGASVLAAGIIALMCTHCGSTPADDAATAGASEAMSTVVHSVYGVTSFGGPGDYQPLACGGSSRTADPWYVASSQRYGCNKHLKVVAGARCLVVYTADAGPASFVEKNAGIAVLDASPAVGKYLFDDGSLGWSDIKAHPGKFEVRVTPTDLPLGPCGGGADPSPPPGGVGTDAGGGTGAGGAACGGDGDCNPGDDGSGKICVSGACVPGCHRDAQCPGVTRCVSGSCE